VRERRRRTIADFFQIWLQADVKSAATFFNPAHRFISAAFAED
jgi:hypothetical protein